MLVNTREDVRLSDIRHQISDIRYQTSENGIPECKGGEAPAALGFKVSPTERAGSAGVINAAKRQSATLGP